MAELDERQRAGSSWVVRANDHSIAWGIAQACAPEGAEIALFLPGRRVPQACRALGRKARLHPSRRCRRSGRWSASTPPSTGIGLGMGGRLDFLIHAIRLFPTRTKLAGRFIETSRENFKKSLDDSRVTR